MKYLALTLTTIILLGCQQNVSHSFGLESKLVGKTIIGENQLIDPWDLTIIDTFLIISNKRSDPVIEVFSLSGKHIKSGIKRGESKDSISFVGSLDGNSMTKSIDVFDLSQRKMLRIDLKKFIDNNPSALDSIPHDDISIKGIELEKYIVGDSILIFENRTPLGRLLVYNKNKQTSKLCLQYPDAANGDITPSENAKLYAVGLATNENKNKIVLGTYSAGILTVCDIVSDSVQLKWEHIDFLQNEYKRMSVFDTSYIALTQNSRYGYTDILATNDYIFAVFSGRKQTEKNYYFSNLVRIVDWNGKIKKTVILDKDISRIVVTPDNEKLFAIAITDDGLPAIVEYSIKQILK